MMKWTAAIIAGGGAAGIVHGVNAAIRAKSTVLTGGFGNSAVATAELGGALIVSLLALVAPLAAFVIVVLILWLAIHLIRRLRRPARRTDQDPKRTLGRSVCGRLDAFSHPPARGKC